MSESVAHGASHPMWRKDVHPWEGQDWVCYVTTSERGERLHLCWHCGEEWPCIEAVTRDIGSAVIAHGVPGHLPEEPGATLPGLTYCKRCGLLLEADNRPKLDPDRKPCRVVRIDLR